MVQQTTVPQAMPAGQPASWPPEVAGLLGQVQALLEQDQPAAALEQIRRSGLNSPWLVNAAAVCRLRLGNPKVAVETFRGLVLGAGGLVLREDVPALYKINFATALLIDGNLSGGLRVLDEVREEGHPAVVEIRDAIRRWKAGMTFWQRLWRSLGGEPSRPLVLDFPPGRLG
jgi:hypothetical protein